MESSSHPVAWSWTSLLQNVFNSSDSSGPHDHTTEAHRSDRHGSRISIRITNAASAHEASETSTSGSNATEIVIPRSLLRHLTRRTSPTPVSTSSAVGASEAGDSSSSSSSSNNSSSSSTSITSAQPSPPSGTGREETTAAAAAELHRLTNNQVLDVQAAASWIDNTTPYLLLLAAVFVYHYVFDILKLAWATASVVRINRTVRLLVARKRGLPLYTVIVAMLHVLALAWTTLFITSGWWLWQVACLIPLEHASTFGQSAFTVIISDSMVRLLGTLPKLLAIVGYQSCGLPLRALKQEGQILTLLEHVLILYRTVLPAPIWFHYFLHSNSSTLLSSLTAGTYLTMKATAAFAQLKSVWLAAHAVFRTGALYGTFACAEDILEGGNQCPICQDSVQNGIKLDCHHCFCEDCIVEWLERDRTCPMCRAEVRPPGLQQYNDGSTSLLPVLF